MERISFDDGLLDLAAAIVRQAADDYRSTREYISCGLRAQHQRELAELEGRKHMSVRDRERAEDLRVRVKTADDLLSDTVEFFHSGWFQALGGEEYMYQRLKAECDRGSRGGHNEED